MKIPFKRQSRKAADASWTALGRILGVTAAINLGNAPPAGRNAVEADADNSGLIQQWRGLYYGNSLVRGAIRNMSRQAVQTGPRIVTVRGEDGDQFMAMRPVGTAPHTRMVDWLKAIGLWYIVDGEIFIVQDTAPALDGGQRVVFKVLDAARVRPARDGDYLIGWTDGIKKDYGLREVLHLFDWESPAQWRGVSALESAIEPAQALDYARQAMSAAFHDYGNLPGYWTLPETFWATLEPAAPGEDEAATKTREDRNARKLNTALTLTAGQTPRVHEGTTYTAINRSGDAFMRAFPDYWRSKTSEIARALGVPDYIVSGSVRDTNYSALKIAYTDAINRYLDIQQVLNQVIEWCYLRWRPGGSEITDIRWPPQPPLDVQKEYYAIGSAMGSRLVSPQTAMGQIGLHYETEIANWGQWQQDMTDKGVGVPTPIYPVAPAEVVDNG